MIPVDVYEPFTLRVRERLERYVDRVDELHVDAVLQHE